MTVKIHALEVEGMKRVKAVTLEPKPDGLTVIGGRNGQGKTTLLEAICFALGGEKHRVPVQDGAEEGRIAVTLTNGVVVERKGKNQSLKVTAPSGKGSQSLLWDFVSEFALNVPKFMLASATEKANMLLGCFPGLAARLQKADEKIKALYDQRHGVGVIATQKQKYADELPYDETAPEEVTSGAQMADRLKAALAVNASNRAARQDLEALKQRHQTATRREVDQRALIERLEKELTKAKEELSEKSRDVAVLLAQIHAAESKTERLKDEDTTAIEREMEEIDAINARVRSNLAKRHAEDEAQALREDYTRLEQELEAAREERMGLLAEVELPLPELSIDDQQQLLYRGRPWEDLAMSERLKVSAAICASVKPECGFVLVDALEQMDLATLAEFGRWAEERGLQVIGTRVSTGSENTIIIEDGEVMATAPERKKRVF